MIVEAEDWDGPAYQSCVDAANVCRKFETKRRRLDLSFKHHREVASLPEAEADALLDWAMIYPQTHRKSRQSRPPFCGLIERLIRPQSFDQTTIAISQFSATFATRPQGFSTTTFLRCADRGMAGN